MYPNTVLGFNTQRNKTNKEKEGERERERDKGRERTKMFIKNVRISGNGKLAFTEEA